MEIPIEVIKNLLAAVDLDMDEKASVEELSEYAKQKHLPFGDNTIVEMFREAS